MELSERVREFIEQTSWAKGLLEKSTPGAFLAILTGAVTVVGVVSKALSLDKPIAMWLSHAIVTVPGTKEQELKGWFIAILLIVAAVAAALLLMIIWVVKSKFVQSSEQLALNEIMGSVRQIRDQAKQTTIKAWDSMTFVYLINKDFSGSQTRVAAMRAIDTPVHFWESVNAAEDEADPVASFSKINYRVRDLDSPASNLVYLPTDNGARTKRACIFFLPPIEPGKARRFETSFQWPGMFKRLKQTAEDFEFTTTTRAVLPLYRVEVYLQEGTGRTLHCKITGDQYATQRLTQATYSVNGWVGHGHVYEVTGIPEGPLRLILKAELKT